MFLIADLSALRRNPEGRPLRYTFLGYPPFKSSGYTIPWRNDPPEASSSLVGQDWDSSLFCTQPTSEAHFVSILICTLRLSSRMIEFWLNIFVQNPEESILPDVEIDPSANEIAIPGVISGESGFKGGSS